MIAKSLWVRMTACTLLAFTVSIAALSAQAAPETLATVRIPQAVTANGQPLPAGTYGVRVSAEKVAPVVGQGPDSARWVEFVQGGQVRGKELAAVVAPADVKAVAKRTPPAEGRGLVTAIGSEFVRVWVNHGGSQYLVHLTVAPR
jgi:hypothetical protein